MPARQMLLRRIGFGRRTACLLCLLPLWLGDGGMLAAAATEVSPDEMAAARRWAAAKFEASTDASKPNPGLVVLANHDAVLQNTRGKGRPLTIAKTTYPRGLYCHAASQVVVRLPGPGKTFSAVVGVDSNVQTIGGRGSVVFSVRVGGNRSSSLR